MDIPTSVTGLLVGAGVLLIITALIGGGLELKGIKIPSIAVGARVLSFIVGAALIALAMVPGVNKDAGDDDRGIPPESTIAVASLTGLSLDAARREIKNQGLEVGTVTQRSVWAPDDTVLDQSPKSGAKAKPGDKVNIVVANSEFEFRVERKITSKEESLTASTYYKVTRLPAGEGRAEAGEFMITRADLAPANPRAQEIINRLQSTRGYFPIDASDDYKLESSWEAFAELGQELGEKMAVDIVHENQKSGFSGMGKAVWMALIGVETGFDIRSIFTTLPAGGDLSAQPINLQQGTALMSSLRVQGPPAVSAAGAERTYELARRAPNGDHYKKVGSASYSVADGLLKKLNAMFHLGDEEDTLYVIRMSR